MDLVNTRKPISRRDEAHAMRPSSQREGTLYPEASG